MKANWSGTVLLFKLREVTFMFSNLLVPKHYEGATYPKYIRPAARQNEARTPR